MKIVGTEISMVRGDTEVLAVSITKDGVQQDFVPGDTVYLSVRKNLKSLLYAFQKVVTTFIEGKAYVRIEPDDTKTLAAGEYVYDVQVTFAPLTEFDLPIVKTIIWPSAFIIEQEVTVE